MFLILLPSNVKNPNAYYGNHLKSEVISCVKLSVYTYSGTRSGHYQVTLISAAHTTTIGMMSSKLSFITRVN